MRENYRNSIASIKKFPQFTTMHVIDGQAGLIICGLIFYSLTIDNILNIIVLLILAGISISMLSGDNSILQKATDAKIKSDEAQIKERIQLAYHSALAGGKGSYTYESLEDELEKEFGENNYNVDDSDSDNWVLTAKGQSVTIPAGKVVDTIWQNALKNNYNYDHYVLDEDKKTITLRSGPGVSGESIEIKKYAIIDGVKYETKFPDSCTSIFYGNNLKTISIAADVDTSNITNATGMFACSSITTITAPNLITNKTTNMSGMFDGCRSLTNLDITGWDTSNVTDMSRLFYNCYSLETLDLSNWDTGNVTKMGYMFCVDNSDTYESQLTTIYASNKFVTDKVADVSGRGYSTALMFGNTKKLVGGNGSTYYHTAANGACDLWGIDGARIDTAETPGLFTAK